MINFKMPIPEDKLVLATFLCLGSMDCRRSWKISKLFNITALLSGLAYKFLSGSKEGNQLSIRIAESSTSRKLEKSYRSSAPKKLFSIRLVQNMLLHKLSFKKRY